MSLKNVEGDGTTLFMDKKDEAVTTSACRCLAYTYGSICISRGPTYFFLLQCLEIWSFLTLQYKHARADCDEVHSKHQKRWFAILRI